MSLEYDTAYSRTRGVAVGVLVRRAIGKGSEVREKHKVPMPKAEWDRLVQQIQRRYGRTGQRAEKAMFDVIKQKAAALEQGASR
jgi:hypothetical protein